MFRFFWRRPKTKNGIPSHTVDSVRLCTVLEEDPANAGMGHLCGDL
jgi:hypothetical protein